MITYIDILNKFLVEAFMAIPSALSATSTQMLEADSHTLTIKNSYFFLSVKLQLNMDGQEKQEEDNFSSSAGLVLLYSFC